MNAESVDKREGDAHVEELSENIPDLTRANENDHPQQERSSEEFLISGGPGEEQRVSLEGSARVTRSLTFVHGLALVIGLQIGSGIFSAPAAVRSYVSSTGLAMFAWVIGGIIAATGAASFESLGKLVPLNGGIQEYLRFIYGDLFGFLFAWVWIFVSRPLALAMVSLIFSEYLFKAVLPEQTISGLALKTSAIFAVVAITWLNCMGTGIGTGIGNVFLFLKIFGLGSIALVGIPAYIFGLHAPAASPLGNPQVHRTMYTRGSIESMSETSNIWSAFSSFVEAVLAAAFAYGGWESVRQRRHFRITMPF